MTKKYILDGKIPKEVDDTIAWAKGFEIENRRVAETFPAEGIRVSTVFLGIDHNFHGQGAPILFETMIFGGPHNDYQERYSTWEEAEAGHAVACRLALEPDSK